MENSNLAKEIKRERAIVFMGTPHFAIPSLERLYNDGYIIKAVVTAPDRASGRGLKVSSSEVKQRAQELGLPILQPDSLKSEEFIEQLKTLGAALFVVVAFRMLPKEVWQLPPLGTINLHSSLLPQYRGAAPINHAIINGETESGITTFLIDEKIDTGEVLMQKRVSIGSRESAGSLHDKLMIEGASLLSQTVEQLFNGTLSPITQELLAKSKGGTALNSAPKLTRENRRVDWNRSDKDIYNLIRGLSPYPAAFTNLVKGEDSIEVKIFETSPKIFQIDQGIILKPGEIESDQRSYLRVGCGSGSLLITSLQMAGKKALPIEQFLAGVRDIESYHFE